MVLHFVPLGFLRRKQRFLLIKGREICSQIHCNSFQIVVSAICILWKWTLSNKGGSYNQTTQTRVWYFIIFPWTDLALVDQHDLRCAFGVSTFCVRWSEHVSTSEALYNTRVFPLKINPCPLFLLSWICSDMIFPNQSVNLFEALTIGFYPPQRWFLLCCFWCCRFWKNKSPLKLRKWLTREKFLKLWPTIFLWNKNRWGATKGDGITMNAYHNIS